MSQPTSSESSLQPLLTVLDLSTLLQQSVHSVWRMRTAREMPAPIRVVKARFASEERTLMTGSTLVARVNLPPIFAEP